MTVEGYIAMALIVIFISAFIFGFINCLSQKCGIGESLGNAIALAFGIVAWLIYVILPIIASLFIVFWLLKALAG